MKIENLAKAPRVLSHPPPSIFQSRIPHYQLKVNWIQREWCMGLDRCSLNERSRGLIRSLKAIIVIVFSLSVGTVITVKTQFDFDTWYRSRLINDWWKISVKFPHISSATATASNYTIFFIHRYWEQWFGTYNKNMDNSFTEFYTPFVIRNGHCLIR